MITPLSISAPYLDSMIVIPNSSNEQTKVSFRFDSSQQIHQSEDIDSKIRLFGPPIISIIWLVEETYSIGNALLQSATDQLKYISDILGKKMTEQMEALQKAASRAQAMDVWSILQKIGTWIFCGTNLFLGFSAYENSPEVATALIGAGLLSGINLLVSELKGWDRIAETLAGENIELKEKLAYWSPFAISCLSGLLSIMAGPSVLFDKSLFPSSFYFSPGICIQLYFNITQAGNSIAGSMFSWTQAELSSIQNAIFYNFSLQEFVVSAMESFFNVLEHGRQEARNIIQLTSQLRS